MKKILLSGIAGFILLASCNKKDDPAPIVDGGNAGGSTPNTVTAVPASFTKKVLIEKFTGAWCGYCPDGVIILEEVHESKPNTVIVSFHQGDAMDDLRPTIYRAVGNTLYFKLNTTNDILINGFPSAIIDRFYFNAGPSLSRGVWSQAVDLRLPDSASCGLAIESKYNTNKDSVIFSIHAGFKEVISGDIRLTAYLIEDSVTGSGSGYDQTNYYSSQMTQMGYQPAGGSTHPLYSSPYTITGYIHNHLVRKIITANAGEVVPTANISAGNKYVYTDTIPVKSTYDKNNLKLVGFIHIVGANSQTHEVLNAQETKIGILKNWD